MRSAQNEQVIIYEYFVPTSPHQGSV